MKDTNINIVWKWASYSYTLTLKQNQLYKYFKTHLNKHVL